MRKKRPPAEPAAAPPRRFHDAFGSLRDRLPAGWTPPATSTAAAPGAPAPPARAVVRLERKGRGGKEATLVEKLGLSPAALGAWLDEAKRALGCGGVVEDGALVLQGDQRERVARWLERRGVGKVVIGN
ncbi:MAG TPA: translation initiation factor [Anaeromyxobacter sp.]